MVNPKIPKNSNKNPTLPPGLQDSSQHVGESPDSLNLISRTSSRAGKQVHSRGRPQTHCIARRSSRGVSASSASRNPSLEALSSSSSGESEEESMGSDPRMPTAPRMTIGKLSSKRLPSLKLPAAFPALIPEGRASTMSWDDQVSAEEGRDLVFGPETAPQAIQRPQAPMLGPFNMIHGSAESAPQLGRECDVTHDCDTSSHTLSHSVMRDSVTHNITHDTDLWDGDHHVTLLSDCDIYLKANAKVLATSLRRLACFIQKRPLKSRPIEQFPSVLGVHSRGRPQTRCIARHSSRSVSASSAKGTLLLRPYLHLPQEKVRRKVWVLTPRCLLLQE